MRTRLARLAEHLAEPLLVGSEASIRYLTGFKGRGMAVVLEDGGALLYANAIYADDGLLAEGVTRVVTRGDVTAEISDRFAKGRLAFDPSHLTYADHSTLAQAGIELVPRRGLVEKLRAIKEPIEVEAIARAAMLTDQVLEALAAERFTGRTEFELALWAEQRFYDLGALERPPWGCVVIAGANAGSPHHTSSNAVVREGTAVIVDVACLVEGYCSDCTRVFVTGELPTQLAEAFELCLRAQLDGIAAVRPGVRSRDADAASRLAIGGAGLAELYCHGMGHGVGLDGHEAPWLQPNAPEDSFIEAGNVVAVEPGLYFPGVGGVRVENLLLVTSEGSEQLSRFPNETVIVE